MRRRNLFPLVLLGATCVLSGIGALAGSPGQSYDYLDALAVDERYALGTLWEETNIPHAEKLNDADKTLFVKMLESLDAPDTSEFEREIFLDQAKDIAATNQCSGDAETCTYSVFLNRTLKPNFIHGDLRLVSLDANSVRQDITLYPQQNRVDYGPYYNDTRQLRYILTERGWVIKTAEKIMDNQIGIMPAQAVDSMKMAGINYYPASSPWDAFWEEFPEEQIAKDLITISELGANSIRIFLQHEYFSNLDTQKDGLEKLNRLMDMFAARDLKVIVTLFDLRGDYRFQNWSRDSVHLLTILDAINAHPALLAIDLKNQADLDFERAGRANVLAWAKALIVSARQAYPDVPLTIGWSDSSEAANLVEQLNLISFHDYHAPENLSARLETVREFAGGKPVFVTEIGHSRWSPIGERTQRQANQLGAQLKQLGSADGVFIWTLNDFEKIGSNIVGHRPWRKAQQKTYGIVTPEGIWRPAAKTFHAFNSEFTLVNSKGE